MSHPFNAEPNTGRMGYRTEFDAPDERPLLYIAHSFWLNESERLAYEDEVERNPIQDDEYRLAYLAKISEAVLAKYGKNIGLPSRTELL